MPTITELQPITPVSTFHKLENLELLTLKWRTSIASDHIFSLGYTVDGGNWLTRLFAPALVKSLRQEIAELDARAREIEGIRDYRG